jgi:hypothetical protein
VERAIGGQRPIIGGGWHNRLDACLEVHAGVADMDVGVVPGPAVPHAT